jgi:hypothetical protein
LNLKKYPVIHADHIHTDYHEYWLNNFTKDGRLLNVCSGTSLLGDVRLDVDPDSNRTQPGDVFDLSEFKDQEFDYVYCDPPFPFYTNTKILQQYKNKWQFELWRLTKKALITRRPKVNINIPSKRHHWIVLEDWRPSISLLRVDWR